MVTGWYRNLVTRTLPQLHERWSVAEELLTSRRHGCSAFVPNEPRPFAILHDIQAPRSPNEAFGRNDSKKKGSIGVMLGLT